MRITKQERLRKAVEQAYLRNQLPPTHQQNEGGWAIMAVEPIFAALDWPRSPIRWQNGRKEFTSDGAAYEWPRNHAADLALLDHGVPIAVMEYKKRKLSARQDPLNEKKQAHVPNKSAIKYFMYSWHDDGGGFGWMPFRDSMPQTSEARIFELSASPNDSGLVAVAELARPVMLAQMSATAWLESTTEDMPPEPRIDMLRAQAWFFQSLQHAVHEEFGVSFVASPQIKKMGACTLPTATEAYTDIPGVVPTGWGIAMGLWGSEDLLKCYFYHGTKDHLKPAEEYRFAASITNEEVAQFVREQVVPRLRKHSAIPRCPACGSSLAKRYDARRAEYLLAAECSHCVLESV
jgi:hypothetical protein